MSYHGVQKRVCCIRADVLALPQLQAMQSVAGNGKKRSTVRLAMVLHMHMSCTLQ